MSNDTSLDPAQITAFLAAAQKLTQSSDKTVTFMVSVDADSGMLTSYIDGAVSNIPIALMLLNKHVGSLVFEESEPAILVPKKLSRVAEAMGDEPL